MESITRRKKYDLTAEIFFYILVFTAITCFAVIQAFGDPPDEINRFKVVYFICRYGRLPHGADPEILLGGYGASYAFQPILTYIIQGFLLRFLTIFTSDSYVLILAARMVNVVFGTLMAYFVRQISKELWDNPYLQWLFTIMVVFLPQNIFIHSYVNTDSMALLSVSIICYALLRAQKTDYEKKDCILLAVGIILCALSYYNAYGIVLAAVIIFIANYVHAGKIEWQPMFRKGFFITAIVLAGISWWFIRNGILYHGDILALNARSECAAQTALPEFNPLTRPTLQNSGYSLSYMLFEVHFVLLTVNSFIATFGPMLIPTHGLIYSIYKYFWLMACLTALFIPHRLWYQSTENPWRYKEGSLPESNKKKKLTFYGSIILFCLITISLSIIYSYTFDFQPQGRYILPVLIPFMYLVTSGVQKLCGVLQRFSPPAGKLLCLGIIFFVLSAFSYSLFITLWEYYSQNANFFLFQGQQLIAAF